MYTISRVAYYALDDSELVEILIEVYKLDYRPTLSAIYEIGGDDSGGRESYCVAKHPNWKEDEAPDLSDECDWPPLEEILDDLASRNLIPEGDYMVEFCWG